MDAVGVRGKGVVQRGRHKKQSGGHGQYGDVVLDIKPLPRGGGFSFEEKITGGVVPRNYIPAVEEGIVDALAHGPLGFPVVDLTVALIDGSYHTVDSSDMAFRLAGRLGIVEALPQCQPVLLEPIHLVEIVCPTEATAKIKELMPAVHVSGGAASSGAARTTTQVEADQQSPWPSFVRIGSESWT